MIGTLTLVWAAPCMGRQKTSSLMVPLSIAIHLDADTARQ